MTDDLWTPLTPATPTGARRKPHRHRWSLDGIPMAACASCGKPRDPSTSRRGRNNRKRGTGFELVVARQLGGRKVGPLGHPWDVEVEGYSRVQVKLLDSWPSVHAMLAMLDAIPAGRELRLVVVGDTPGGSRRRRAIVLMDLDEYAAWHGRR